jgi:hypothetical protein
LRKGDRKRNKAKKERIEGEDEDVGVKRSGKGRRRKGG